MIAKIEQILKTTLMISVKNLASELHNDIAQLKDTLYVLEKTGKIRIAYGKGCHSGCTSCNNTCEPKENNEIITDSTIIISLIQKCNVSGGD